jgi:hypothetical protein
MTSLRSSAACFSLVLFAAACVGGEPDEGEERGSCRADGGCDEDYLVCNQDNICVVPEIGQRGAPCRKEWEGDPCDDGLLCDERGFCSETEQGTDGCQGSECPGPEVQCESGFHPEGSKCVENSYGIVMGKVVDARSDPEFPSPVKNAKIALGGQKVASNEQGFFSLTNVPAEVDSVLDIRAEGYANNKRTVTARTGVSTHVDITLLPFTAQSRFSSDAGGTISGDGAMASFGGGSQEVAGMITASMALLRPDVYTDLPAFPGDFSPTKKRSWRVMALSLCNFPTIPVTRSLSPRTERSRSRYR